MWNADVISNSHCPFSFIEKSDFSRVGDSVLYDNTTARAFKVLRKERNCQNIDMWVTQEKLYLTTDAVAAKKSQEVLKSI